MQPISAPCYLPTPDDVQQLSELQKAYADNKLGRAANKAKRLFFEQKLAELSSGRSVLNTQKAMIKREMMYLMAIISGPTYISALPQDVLMKIYGYYIRKPGLGASLPVSNSLTQSSKFVTKPRTTVERRYVAKLTKLYSIAGEALLADDHTIPYLAYQVPSGIVSSAAYSFALTCKAFAYVRFLSFGGQLTINTVVYPLCFQPRLRLASGVHINVHLYAWPRQMFELTIRRLQLILTNNPTAVLTVRDDSGWNCGERLNYEVTRDVKTGVSGGERLNYEVIRDVKTEVSGGDNSQTNYMHAYAAIQHPNIMQDCYYMSPVIDKMAVTQLWLAVNCLEYVLNYLGVDPARDVVMGETRGVCQWPLPNLQELRLVPTSRDYRVKSPFHFDTPMLVQGIGRRLICNLPAIISLIKSRVYFVNTVVVFNNDAIPAANTKIKKIHKAYQEFNAIKGGSMTIVTHYERHEIQTIMQLPTEYNPATWNIKFIRGTGS